MYKMKFERRKQEIKQTLSRDNIVKDVCAEVDSIIKEDICAEVNIMRINGQSFFPSLVFKGEYSIPSADTIAKHVAVIFSQDIFEPEVFDKVHVEVGADTSDIFKEDLTKEVPQLVLDIFSEIYQHNSKMKPSSRELCSGSDFGFNVYVSLKKQEHGEKSPAPCSNNREEEK